MVKGITFIGLDVHKEAINVAMLLPGEARAVEWQMSNTEVSLGRLVKKLKRIGAGELRLCYEAGPCGYSVQRTLLRLGVCCVVVAPSLVPRKPGDRVKTDRRDARKLAELLRGGLLTEVCPPTEADEAVRDLCRAREDAHQDLVRGRHRVSKLLLRQGRSWTEGKKTWGQGHRVWLRSLCFEQPEDQWVLEDYLLALEQLEERLRGLDARIEQVSVDPRYADAVAALRCFRGIDTLTAMSLVAELHDFMRFDAPRGLMAYLGLVPFENSSGGKGRQGGITKTGNRHVRRLLIEAAWHYRHRPGVVRLRKRCEGQPAQVIAIADKAMHRLHRRSNRMLDRGRPRPKVVVAVARELTGFIWAAMPICSLGMA